MSDYIVLQPMHLGKGQEGERRRLALEHIAAREGHLWDGGPSIGRWLVALADREISDPQTFEMVSDKYGEPRLTTPEQFEVGCRELGCNVSLQRRTDGYSDYYVDQDGDTVLEQVTI